jgi:predicted Zn-dependent protease
MEGYENLRKARELDPQRPGIDGLLAVAEDSLGRTADAHADYSKALAKDPQNSVLLNNLAFLLAEAGGNLDEALQLAQRGLQKEPDDAHLWDTTAWIYIKKSQAQAAASILEKLIRKYPDNSAYHYHYGLALLAKGDKTQARRELQIASRKHPTQNQQNQIQVALQRAS